MTQWLCLFLAKIFSSGGEKSDFQKKVGFCTCLAKIALFRFGTLPKSIACLTGR